MTYSQALKEADKVGAVHTTGDTLAAHMAYCLPFHVCLNQRTAAKHYEHFRTFDTNRKIHDEFERLVKDPGACWEYI